MSAIFINDLPICSTFILSVLWRAIQFSHPRLWSECVSFQSSDGADSNACTSVDLKLHQKSQFYITDCLACTVEYIHSSLDISCSSPPPCISLTFANNAIFEQYFRTNQQALAKQFYRWKETIPSEESMFLRNILKYDLKEISLHYLTITFGAIAESFDTLRMKFFHPILNAPLPKFKNDTIYASKNVSIYLYILCSGSQSEESWITYTIEGRTVRRTQSLNCSLSGDETTLAIESCSKTPVATNSSSTPSKSNLLFVYSIIFVGALLLSIVFIALYIFLRQKLSQQSHMRDKSRLSTMSEDTHKTDQANPRSPDSVLSTLQDITAPSEKHVSFTEPNE